MNKTGTKNSDSKNSGKFKSHDERMTVVTPAGISIEGVSFRQAVAITRAMETLYGASIQMNTQEIPSKPVTAAELKTLKEIEIEAIKKALLENHGNKTDAARDLGIARGTLYRKMKIFGIATNDEVA